MKVPKKRLIIMPIAVLLVAIIVGIILFCSWEKESDISPDTVVAMVNDEPIVFAELCFVAGDIRSEIVSYFYNTYSAEQSEDFWNRNFNGEVPNLKMYSLVFEEAVRVKTEQLMMLEYGITEDLSYNTFYEAFIAENKRRADALEKDEIIYGPKQYTEISYYEYLHNNRLLKLKAEINKKLSGSDELDYSAENFEAEYQKKRDNIIIKPEVEVENRLKKEFYKLMH